MQCQLPWFDLLFHAALLDQAFGQCLFFAMGDHPANNVAAEDIHDHIQVEVSPFGRPLEFGGGGPQKLDNVLSYKSDHEY